MFKRLLAGLLVISVLAVGYGAWIWRPIAPTHPALVASELPPVIPLRAFYANQDSKWAYSLSRDGSRLAWLEIEWFREVLKVKNLDTGKTETLPIPEHSGSWRYYWAPDGHSMMLVVDRSGRETYEIAINDFDDTNSGWQFYDFGENTTSYIQFVPKTNSDEIIIIHNGEDSRYYEFYRLDLKSGETTALGARAEGRQVSYAMDYNGVIFGRTLYTGNNGDWSFETGNPQEGWREVLRGTYRDRLNLFGNLNDDNSMYGVSNIGLNTLSFVRFSLDDGEQEVIFSDQDVDVGWVNIDTRNNALQMIKTYKGIVEARFFDPEFEQHVRSLKPSETAEITIKSNTNDYSKSIVEVFDIKSGEKSVLIDRAKDTAETLTTSSLKPYWDFLPEAESIYVQAEDGLEIPAFLYRPKGVSGPAPTVMIAHGGPVYRHYANTDFSFISLLTNRGYAVLDVNFRGSNGYGRDFAAAAKSEIAGKMSSDIIDVRNWAVGQGISDPDKIGIFGISWGGFEVMTALAQNSDLFAAGININGVADLSTMFDEVPNSFAWDTWKQWVRDHGADPATEAGRKYLQERSPLYHADKIKTPLLIVQAGNDVRVVQGQSDRMVEEMNKHNAPFEYQIIPGVGHSPHGWSWQKKYFLYRDIERFLAKHLGGRAGGFDYAILGAHILPE